MNKLDYKKKPGKVSFLPGFCIKECLLNRGSTYSLASLDPATFH